MYDRLIGDLAVSGYAIVSGFISLELSRALLQESEDHWGNGKFNTSAVGRGIEKQRQIEIRSDDILWLDPLALSDSQKIYWEQMNQFREAINRELFLGIVELEAHLARFAPGGYYKPHLDQHRTSRSRILSTIIYLDENWQESDGGQLRLYTDPEKGVSGPAIDVFPEPGKLVVFLSADYWHEVLVARHARHSLTGWFRSRESF